jgi:hypothetical protein
MDESAEGLLRTVTEWLMAEGIVGWEMCGNQLPLELRLDWGNRDAQRLIERQFGAAVEVSVKPEGAPVFMPQTIGPVERTDPEG